MRPRAAPQQKLHLGLDRAVSLRRGDAEDGSVLRRTSLAHALVRHCAGRCGTNLEVLTRARLLSARSGSCARVAVISLSVCVSSRIASDLLLFAFIAPRLPFVHRPKSGRSEGGRHGSFRTLRPRRGSSINSPAAARMRVRCCASLPISRISHDYFHVPGKRSAFRQHPRKPVNILDKAQAHVDADQQHAGILDHDRVDVAARDRLSAVPASLRRAHRAVESPAPTESHRALRVADAHRHVSTSNSASSVPTIRKPWPRDVRSRTRRCRRARAEADQTLAAAMAAQRRRLELVAEEPRLLPRIFAQVAHADVELNRRHEVRSDRSPRAPSCSDRIHHRSRHPRRPKALLRIAKRSYR